MVNRKEWSGRPPLIRPSLLGSQTDSNAIGKVRCSRDVRWIAPTFAVLTLSCAAMITASQHLARAETWCGDGPGTALNHPCTDADDVDNPAVSAAIKKYQAPWMNIDGVWSVDEAETYNSRAPEISVHVEPKAVKSAKKGIPSSVNGIAVVIVPGDMPEGGGGVYLPIDPEESEREQKIATEREEADAVLEDYDDRWNALPGVIEVYESCEKDPCEERRIVVCVQREFLASVRGEIPTSVKGFQVKVVPDR